MTTKEKPATATSLAKTLAPEDVRRGDYVTLLNVVWEIPSFFWSADACLLPADEPVRVRFIHLEGGMPLKVRRVCLPFVLVKSPIGETRTLDVRRHALARLDKIYAMAAWKALRKSRGKATKRTACSL